MGHTLFHPPLFSCRTKAKIEGGKLSPTQYCIHTERGTHHPTLPRAEFFTPSSQQVGREKIRAPVTPTTIIFVYYYCTVCLCLLPT